MKGVLRILSCLLDATNFEIINTEISHFLQIRLYLTMKTKANLYKLLLIGQKVSIKIDEFLKRMYYSNQIHGGNEEKEEAFKEKLFGKIGFECLLELLSWPENTNDHSQQILKSWLPHPRHHYIIRIASLRKLSPKFWSRLVFLIRLYKEKNMFILILNEDKAKIF